MFNKIVTKILPQKGHISAHCFVKYCQLLNTSTTQYTLAIFYCTFYVGKHTILGPVLRHKLIITTGRTKRIRFFFEYALYKFKLYCLLVRKYALSK